VSAVSGFCKKCNDFRKRYCSGDRNTCMTILFDRIKVLQHENNVAIERALKAEALARELADMLGRVTPCYTEGRLGIDLDAVYEVNGLLKKAKEVLGDE
jgi:hypothetical protein